MSLTEDNINVVRAWYRALGEGDLENLLAVQHDDVAYNVHGKTPVSGRTEGKNGLVNEIMPKVFGKLDGADFRFCARVEIMCADERRVTAFMEAEGTTIDGERYDQLYCHLFELREGRISEVWEFFDSCLAQRALFGNPLTRPEPEPPLPFRY